MGSEMCIRDSINIEESIEKLKNIINGNIKSDKRIDYSETIMDWY